MTNQPTTSHNTMLSSSVNIPTYLQYEANQDRLKSNCSIIRGKTPVLNRSSVRVGHI
jgi:hypothetical protein